MEFLVDWWSSFGALGDGNGAHLSSSQPTSSLQRRLYAAQQEAAHVWTAVSGSPSGGPAAPYPLAGSRRPPTGHQRPVCPYSQTVQMVCHQFLANVESARDDAKPIARSAIPTRTSASFPCTGQHRRPVWSKDGSCCPWDVGRRSLVFKLDLPELIGSVKLVWKDGYACTSPHR